MKETRFFQKGHTSIWFKIEKYNLQDFVHHHIASIYQCEKGFKFSQGILILLEKGGSFKKKSLFFNFKKKCMHIAILCVQEICNLYTCDLSVRH